MQREILIGAVLWDMDGTLTDSEPLHFRAYQKWLAEYNVAFTEEDYRQFLGATDLALCKTLIALHKLPVTPERMCAEKEELYAEIVRDQVVLRPGVKKTLAVLRQHKVKTGVASSATKAAIDLMLGALTIKDYFQEVASGEEVANSKPAPDVFLLGANRLQVKASSCLVVEDSINGIRAAKAAGMYCLAVPCDWTRYQDHSLADMRLNSLDELTSTDRGLVAGDCLIRFV